MMNWYFASGDGDFFWREQLTHFSWLPQVFDKSYGFGFSRLPSLWYDYPIRLFTKIFVTLGFSWFIIEKLLWLSVFFLAIYSSYALLRYILGKNIWTLIAPLIYVSNTYFLLLFGGGQLGVALGFGFAPLVLLKFLELIDIPDKRISRNSLIHGLLVGLLLCFDLRLGYITIAIAGLYFLFHILIYRKKDFISVGIQVFIIPGLIAGLLNALWILPTILAGGGVASLGEQFTNPAILSFLSFADFSHAISLLHPNWPENLFGKVYFMQPEFLVIPIVAFFALLTIDKKVNDTTKKISFFGLLALIGAFLAKGVNAPFGGIFQWMFIHVPGFIMFRDPTKFYLLVAVGYSVLIPYTLQHIAKKIKINDVIVFTIFIVFWCFSIRPVLLGKMKGNFQPPRISADYVHLKDLLVADGKPSRTLWIPQKDAFAYMSDVHPLLTSDQLFNSASVSAVISLIQKPEFMKRLAVSGIGYVIVPTDLEKRLFLTDYRFNPKERNLLITSLKQTTLIQDNDFRDVAVFKNDQFTMTSTVPVIVTKQQRMANIGLIISIVTLASSIGALIVLKRRD